MHDKNFLYKCDPQKNNQCRKTDCQTSCFMTTHKEYSIDGKRYVWNKNALEEWKGDKNE